MSLQISPEPGKHHSPITPPVASPAVTTPEMRIGERVFEKRIEGDFDEVKAQTLDWLHETFKNTDLAWEIVPLRMTETAFGQPRNLPVDDMDIRLCVEGKWFSMCSIRPKTVEHHTIEMDPVTFKPKSVEPHEKTQTYLVDCDALYQRIVLRQAIIRQVIPNCRLM
ncbi:hypothetical protein KBD71_00880 [Candidatus Woesebacteria bacterium]|nr:hypothetical protein [Candidatus Woesebacteria bacterium]